MRPIRTVALAVALAVTLAACSGSSGKDTGAAGSSAAGSGTTATTDGPATVATTAASAAGSASSTGTATSGECATLVEAISQMAASWQIYVQLPGIPDVAEWKRIIEPLGRKQTFTQTLDTLGGAFGDKDSADAISYMRTADGIVQKGLGGDTAAVGELKSHIGTNVMEALLKQAPLSKALAAKGC